jgi:hypothetical protein
MCTFTRFAIHWFYFRDGGYITLDNIDDKVLHSLRWTVDPRFPEVPAELLGSEAWTTLVAKPWEFRDGILNLEARATVSSIERLVNCIEGCNDRVLVLGGNLTVVLAFGRCRAKDFKLLNQVRRSCACCLARNLEVCFRWCRPNLITPILEAGF